MNIFFHVPLSDQIATGLFILGLAVRGRVCAPMNSALPLGSACPNLSFALGLSIIVRCLVIELAGGKSDASMGMLGLPQAKSSRNSTKAVCTRSKIVATVVIADARAVGLRSGVHWHGPPSL